MVFARCAHGQTRAGLVPLSMSKKSKVSANGALGRDPTLINADLHCHSTVSDGTLSPTELAHRAAAAGVHLWSLTDHDELDGLDEARQAATDLGMEFISGVEISVTWAGDTLHIVGLNVDHHNEALEQGIASIRDGRGPRAQEMGAQLAKAGIQGAFEGALTYAGNPALVSRTHFARFLVERGYCTDVREVFMNYLVPGKPGYVPHRWASLTQAVGWIRGAGGVAVLAHPGRYRLTDLMLHALFEEFVALGGQGVEVVTASHTVDQYLKFAKLSLQYNLMASRGSDFHGPSESRVNLGELPPLPDGCVPIWTQWA